MLSTDIPFTSRSLGTEDGGVEFSNISLRATCLSSIHVATRFIGEQDQQDRHEKLAGLSADIPSSSSKSCTSIIKIVRAAYVRTRNHYTQRESFEYSFARHIAGIHRCFMDALRDGSPRWSCDFNGDSLSHERGSAVTPIVSNLALQPQREEDQDVVKISILYSYNISTNGYAMLNRINCNILYFSQTD